MPTKDLLMVDSIEIQLQRNIHNLDGSITWHFLCPNHAVVLLKGLQHVLDVVPWCDQNVLFKNNICSPILVIAERDWHQTSISPSAQTLPRCACSLPSPHGPRELPSCSSAGMGSVCMPRSEALQARNVLK